MTAPGIALSVPGKLILMGEHAAVFSRPALVAALDLRLGLRLEPAPHPGEVEIDLPGLGHRERVSWSSILAHTRLIRQRWSEYVAHPSATGFQKVKREDPAHLVKLALGETEQFLGEEKRPGLKLSIRSAVPVGGGFGSSAAVAVGVIAGYLRYRGVAAGRGEIDRLALEVERRQHGQPSGVDTATVLRGGVLWASREPGGGLALTPLPAAPLLARFRVFHTGRPRQSTGEVVAHVRSQAQREGKRFERLLDRMEEATRALRRQLLAATVGEETVEVVRDFQACLEALGVVPQEVRDLVRRVESRGGAAKISGAGALSGPAAGSVMVYHPSAAQISSWGFLKPYPETAASLGAEGMREEQVP